MLITAAILSENTNLENCKSFVIYGGEPLQTQESLQLIKAQLQNLGYTETEVLELQQGGNTWEDLLTSRDNLSLFATKKIIVLPIHGSIDKTGTKVLAEFTTNLPPHIALIVIINNLTKKDFNVTWVNNINNNGMVINASEVHISQLTTWIENRLNLKHLNATIDAIALLAFYYEGNVSACAQTIEKLSLYFGDTNSHLTVETIEEFIHNSARFNIFDFTSALFAFDGKKCFHILNSLKEQGAEPTLILWALTRELRTLIQIREAMNCGLSLELCCKNFMVWSSKVPLIKTTLAKLTLKDLKLILQKANTIDLIIKNIVNENFSDSLQSLCLAVLGFNSLPLEEIHT